MVEGERFVRCSAGELAEMSRRGDAKLIGRASGSNQRGGGGINRFRGGGRVRSEHHPSRGSRSQTELTVHSHQELIDWFKAQRAPYKPG